MSKFETHRSSNDDENFFGHFTEHVACIPISSTQRVRDHLKKLLEIHENYALGPKTTQLHQISANQSKRFDRKSFLLKNSNIPSFELQLYKMKLMN